MGKKGAPIRCDVIGKRFGRLFVTGIGEPGRKNETRYRCECDCGESVDLYGYALTSGRTKSCGCLRRDNTRAMKTVHGMYGTSEYKSWTSMKDRCLNPDNHAYKDYGGRGIGIYKPWIDSFEAFYSYMGDKPDRSYSIDRIDNDRGYEPGNVRWATDRMQCENRRNVRHYDFQGLRMLADEIGEHIGVRRGVVRKLLNRGHELDEIVEDIVFNVGRLYNPNDEPYEVRSIPWNGRNWTTRELADHFDVSYSRVNALLSRHANSSVEYALSILTGEVRDRYNRVRPGDHFGRLTVLSEYEEGGRPRKWLTKCSCDGKELVVHQSNLVSGHTKSCGCLRFSTHQYS